jgi:hypothetical protein
MDSSGDPTPSEMRLIAIPADDRERIEQALAQAEAHVARMHPSPATRHLEGTLESCRRMIDGWDVSPPTEDVLRALRERVQQTLHLARTTSPTVRLRRAG